MQFFCSPVYLRMYVCTCALNESEDVLLYVCSNFKVRTAAQYSKSITLRCNVKVHPHSQTKLTETETESSTSRNKVTYSTHTDAST